MQSPNDSTDTENGIPEYLVTKGPNSDMTNKSPIEYFHLMIPDTLLEGIVEQTNLYADQFFQSSNVPPQSRAQLWDNKKHDLDKLKKFLSLIIVMECIHYPAIEEFWCTSWPFATGTFSSILKRDSFSLLLRFCT